MPFITLEHLRRTAAALLEKIHEKLSIDDVQINDYKNYEPEIDGNYTLGTINHADMVIPSNWIHDIVPTYYSLTPSPNSSTPSLVTPMDKYRWNHTPIGYIDSNVLYVMTPATSTSGSLKYSGLFYFYVPSSGTGSNAGVANTLITSVKFVNTSGVVSTYGQSVNRTFTESGLYIGWNSDGFSFYKLPSHKDILIGHIEGNTLVAPNNTANMSGSTFGFYFVVSSSGYGTSGQGTANIAITSVKAGATSYPIASTYFTKSGLYRGWMNNSSFVYEEVGGSADSPVFTTQITIGNTTMTEAQLSNLLSVASNLTAAAGVSF